MTNPHTNLINDILRAAGSRQDCRIWKNSTGAAISGDRFLRFGIRGQSDITGIYHDGRRLEIEVKTGAASLSRHQLAFAKMIKKYGGIFILARSVNDVLDTLNSMP